MEVSIYPFALNVGSLWPIWNIFVSNQGMFAVSPAVDHVLFDVQNSLNRMLSSKIATLLCNRLGICISLCISYKKI